ncbi:MAG: Gfo/Idh/MocA family oxidoreductase [Planctomycetaceae bacterium]|nr:Gfo/Idh/MocA family oxidoreductase [Planctomycetaceae bacterium]
MSKRITRRSFLEQSMLSAAALGAAAFAGSSENSLLAQEEKNVSANEKLGVVVVGTGSRGYGSHCSQWGKDKNTKVLYLCDPDEKIGNARCADFEKEFGYKPKFVRDMREAFDDKSLDFASCATSNHWHALTGIWAMQAGLHCYIEKPVCHNVHEGKALIAAAKKYDRCVQTGSQCRSNPANIDANKFIRDGGIGEVKFARGLCYKRRKSIGAKGIFEPPKSVDYDLWSGPAQVLPVTRPNFHYDWHWQRLYGNGDLGNQGPHQTDICRWHLGVNRFPNAVISYGGRLGYEVERKDEMYIDAGDTANTETVICDYGDKCIVFEVRGLETPDYQGASIGAVIYGSEGYLVQSSYNYSAAFDKEGKKTKEFKGGDDRLHFNNFIEAIRKNNPSHLAADAECGALSAGISHLGNISWYLGETNKVSVDDARKTLAEVKSLDDNGETLDRMAAHLEANGVDLKKTPISMGPLLRFDPEKELFVDNDAANALLTRDYRVPFVVPEI